MIYRYRIDLYLQLLYTEMFNDELLNMEVRRD